MQVSNRVVPVLAALGFALTGALLLGFSLKSEQGMRSTPTIENVARDLLLNQCPLTGRRCTFLGTRYIYSIRSLLLQLPNLC